MIDPEAPVAQYFDGWSPGTVVYNKTRGVLGGKEPQIAARKVAESFVGKKGKKEDAKADEVPPVDEF
jgi:glycogen debranching enzyme